MRFHLRLSFFIIILYINPKLNAGDNNPPTPSPAPEPHPDDESSLSCVDDLGGVGSLDSTCKLVDRIGILAARILLNQNGDPMAQAVVAGVVG
ncbi:hypothetical protein Bca4012_098082 [Brassica carinata]|uniref:Uncharacterized protein n=5 Tax=Brassica TaxID=3705 RepID=A0ABQ7YX81_BRANA|nr:hypothetical protein Bca52824_080775 [Brassica carinata]KAH0872530.1 hypothetical protein HID58_069892 [Brassica napus]CDY49819.1 BnaC06g04500D [Brassica napus]VDD60312.1 unnamed protein product [Brassica oleracea]